MIATKGPTNKEMRTKRKLKHGREVPSLGFWQFDVTVRETQIWVEGERRRKRNERLCAKDWEREQSSWQSWWCQLVGRERKQTPKLPYATTFPFSSTTPLLTLFYPPVPPLHPPPPPPYTAMDAEYLKNTVGDALASALTSLALKQPKDPVDFVGNYLVRYADHLEKEKKVRIR